MAPKAIVKVPEPKPEPKKRGRGKQAQATEEEEEEEPASKTTRHEQSSFVTHLKAAAKAGNTKKAAILKHYQELPHRSAEKHAMVRNHLKDKTGNWYQTIEESKIVSQGITNLNKFGWGSKFDVAGACNIPLDKAHESILQAVLDKLPQDDNWDLSNPLQAGFKAAGQKRYFLDKDEYDTFTKQDIKEDKTSTSHESKLKPGDAGIPMLEDATEVKVKLECPEHTELMAQIKILDTAEPKLSKRLQELRTLSFQLKAMNMEEATRKRTDAQEDIKVLENHLDAVLELLCSCKLIAKEKKEECKAATVMVIAMIKTASYADDAAKLKIKKYKSIVESL